MKSGFLAFAAAALLWAAPALAEAPRTIPIYTSNSGHILVDVTVRGEGPYTFVVDTAASGTVVFEDFARAAGLDDVTGDAVIRVQGASGEVEARLVELGAVEVGDWRFYLERVVSLPAVSHLGEVDGILGIDLLLAQPVGFALGEGELQIYDPDALIDGADLTGGAWFSVPITQEVPGAPLYWTRLTVNGVLIEAVIDTGARRSTINSAGARALGIDPATAALAEDEPIRGATNDETPAFVLPVETVQLGERVWAGRHLTLADMAIFARMGRADMPTIVLGADFLAEQNFIIDPTQGALWMTKRQSAALGYLRRPVTEHSSPPL